MTSAGDTEPERCLPGLIASRAATSPSATAILGLDREPLSYAELDALVQRTAASLRQLAIRPEQRVALVCGNGPEAASAFLGIAAACCCAPLNPAYRDAELDFSLRDLAPAALDVDPDVGAGAARVAGTLGIQVVELHRSAQTAGAFTLGVAAPPVPRPVLAGPGAIALALHTSGTTSRPKLVPLTHRSLCGAAANVAAALELAPHDRCLNVMPLFHVHGLVAAVLGSLHAGGSVACTPGFSAAGFFRWLAELDPTWYTAVPTIHQGVLARARHETGRPKRTRLRVVRSSSAALPAPVADQLEALLGVPVIEAYGMTEAAHQVASNPLPPGVSKRGSVGRATGLDVAILDDQHALQPAGTPGQVAIRGGTVFTGYADNPEANGQAFADGWFLTGDVGRLDDDGYLFLDGRLKEIINRAGEKIAPGEVEDALLAHAAVAEAVSFAVPDDRLGETVGAAVVLREGAAAGEEELQRFVAARLADFKVPHAVAIVEDIPRGPTGKLQRIGLADRLGLATVRPASAPGRSATSPLEATLLRAFADVLDVDELGVDDDFFALGGDSLAAAALVARVGAELPERPLSLTVIVRAPTVRMLALELEAAVGGRPCSLVPIQASGTRVPIFFVHALDGEVVRFGSLARRLGADQPLYGLQAAGLDVLEPEHETIEQMAAAYLAEILQVRPHGPYRLGAICMGGPVAIEIARALHASGETVEQLLLVDPRVPAWALPGPAWQRLLRWARRRAVRRLEPDPAWSADPLVPTFLKRMAEIRDRYVLRRYDGHVTVCVSDQHFPLDWSVAVRGGVEVHPVGGTHRDILRRPAVDRLAALLEAGVAPRQP